MKIKDFNIKIGKYTFHKLIKHTGLQEVVTEYETVENGIGDGVLILGAQVLEREIEIEAPIPINEADAISRYFEPNKYYDLVIGKRYINVLCRHSDIDRRTNLYNQPILLLTLFAPDPFFYDVSDFGENIAGSVPLFGFPWEASLDEGLNFGYREFNERTIFDNNGDRPVGLKMKIEFIGAVSNFKFENLRTGKYFKINHEFVKDDVLEISTVSGDTYVRLNTADIFEQIDIFSDFFKLEKGANFLKYSADKGVTEMNVYLYYSPKYLTGMEDIEL